MHGPPSSGVTLFVGLGRMGAPMVRRYAGTRAMLLFDVDTDVAHRLSTELSAGLSTGQPTGQPTGLRVAPLGDLADPPGEVDTVILMLPDSRVVESVLVGDDGRGGLLDRLARGTLVVDMGSSEPVSTRRLAEVAGDLGLHYVDAPVSGGVAKAATGELAVMVGGDPVAVGLAEPHLAPLGTNIVAVGPSGAGHAAKALNNLLSATNLAAAAEVLCVAQSAGIRPEVMVRVLNSSTGRSQATEVKYPKHVLTGTFSSGFEMELMLKDLATATALGREARLSTPITSRTAETLEDARRWLDATGLDHTEIVRYYEDVNHALLRSAADPSTERPDQ
jgi:3-hydroxyisobutyrate dehydrogenase